MRHTTSRFGLAWVHVLVLLAMAVLAVLAVLGGAPRQALAGHDPDAAGQDAGGRVLALPDLLGSDAPVSQAGDVPTLAQRLALAADAERVSVETEQELVAAAKSVGQKATIVLSADIVLGSGPLEVTDGREFTLDLNGHGLSRNLQAADSDGHVIYIEPHCKLSIVDHGPNRQGTISGGWVSGYGGGILNDGTLDMVNGTIRDNKATIAGAGIANRGDATLTSTTIENNSCRNEGGGVHCERDATIALSGCYIEDNEADSGGGIYLNRLASAVKIMGCHIVGNKARAGGGLYDFVWPDNDQAILAVVSTTMSQNVATEDGGAIYGTAAFGHDTGPATPPITLDSNSKILNNKAGGRGGGIFLEKRYVAKARDVKVSGNECATSGGGIFVDGEEAEAGTLQMEGYVKVEENVRVTAVEESGRTSEGDNVRFASDDNKIMVTGPFERGTHVQVGFDASLSRRMVTTGYERHCAKEDEGGDAATPDPGQFFEGDGDRAAVLRDGEVMVVTRVHYMDERGQEQVIVDYEDVTDAFEGTKGKDGWFVAAHDVELDARPTIDAKASLVVCDGATLTCKQGIEVPKAGSLAVYGQVRQTGTIVADASGVDHAAGIGSSAGGLCGRVTVNGGCVEASGGSQGAGIGCGENWSADRYDFDWNVSGPIVINGGNVRAVGGSSGAGVGHGVMNLDYDFDVGGIVVSDRPATLDVQVHGGRLLAGGGHGGPGIGVTSKAAFTLTVDGGEVEAVGGEGGAGIGGRTGDFCYGSTLTFAGGQVEAVAGQWMPAIGFREVDFTSFDGFAGRRDDPHDAMAFSGAIVEILTPSDVRRPMEGPFRPSSTGDTMVWAGESSLQAERVPDDMRWDALSDSMNRYVLVRPCDHLDASATRLGEEGWQLSCVWCEIDDQGSGWPVSYDAGAGSGQMRDDFCARDADGEAWLTLPMATTFEGPRGTELVGWQVDGEEHAPGDAIRIDGPVSAVAVWRTTWAGVQRFLAGAEATDDPLVLDVDLVAGPSDGALLVPEGAHAEIDLNGHVIDRDLDAPCPKGSVLRVEGELVLTGDGVIRGGHNSSAGDAAGGGVSVASGASLTVRGPTISGNRARSGGGVHTRGTFVLESGDVTSNFCEGSGHRGGGGGVAVDGGTFTMRDAGEVSHNFAEGNGGGVMLRAGTFELDGGRVRDNEATGMGGGVFAGSRATIELSGRPHVQANTAAGTACNVYLQDPMACPLVVEGLGDAAEVGVMVADVPYVGRPVRITRGLEGRDPTACLSSDDAGHILDLSPEGEAVLGLPATVRFDAGTAATGEMEGETRASGGVLEVPDCRFRSVAGHPFVGWRLGDRTLSPGDAITVLTDMTLTALWDDTHPVWVAGTQVSDANKDDVLGDGTVAFDAATCTLTLDGLARVETAGRDAIIDADGVDLTVTGSGTIGLDQGHAECAVEVRGGSLRIGGDLVVEGGACAIHADGDITFTHGSVGVKAIDAAGTGVASSEAGATVTVEGVVRRLEVTAGRRAFDTDRTRPVVVAEGLVVAEPQDGSLSDPHVLIVREGADGWGEPTYAWSDGLATVSATRRRICDPTLCETETVATTARVTKPATCTELGETTYTADFANDAFETQRRSVANVAATGHVPKAEEVRENLVSATCTEAGSYDSVAVCRVCGQELLRTHERLAPLGHDWGEGEVTVEPTCEAPGTVTHTCRREASHVRTDELEALGHAWGDWRVHTPATATDHGLQVRFCERDESHVDRRAIPSEGHVHALVWVDARAPSCLEAGSREVWVCQGGDDPCGLVFLDAGSLEGIDAEEAVIAAHGHVLDAGVVTVEPTCTVDGVLRRTCEVCGATVEEPIKRTQHDTGWVDEPIVAPSCAGPGYRWHTMRCMTCGEPMAKTLVAEEAVGHVEPAQTTREGEVLPTCTEPGSVEFAKRCERCGVELSRTQEAIAPLGHEWGEPTYAWARDGRSVTATRTCARDGAHVETETARVTSTVVRAPTGTRDGVELLVATFENPAFVRQERSVAIPATGGAQGSASGTDDRSEGDMNHIDTGHLPVSSGTRNVWAYGSELPFGRALVGGCFGSNPFIPRPDARTADDATPARSVIGTGDAGGLTAPEQARSATAAGTGAAGLTGAVPATGAQATNALTPVGVARTAGDGAVLAPGAAEQVASPSSALPGTADTAADGLAYALGVIALAMLAVGVRHMRPARA